ncbi:MAG: hypothetical protein ACT4P1_12470 [Sporichthyaceae bacterium]
MTSGLGGEPSLAELLAEARAAADDAIAGLAELNAELTHLGQAERAAREAAEAKRAERARAGELGPEQRRLQERIDLGETSWGAVLSGSDQSPEAGAVWTALSTNVETFTASVEAGLQAERLAGNGNPRAELIEVFAELKSTVAQLLATQNEENPRGQ